MQGPIDFEIRELRITLSDEAAFCHSLCHVRSTSLTGAKLDYWVRVSNGLRKTNGNWLITHEHVSVPLGMEVMQTALRQSVTFRSAA